MPSSPSPISTLVLGTGELGLAVLKALAAHPYRSTITVLLRPSTLHAAGPSKTALLRTLDTLGISTIAGDISSSSEQDLARIFSPYDTLIGCTGMSHHYAAGTQLKIARAVLAAKVRRYIPWQSASTTTSLAAGARGACSRNNSTCATFCEGNRGQNGSLCRRACL